MKRYLRAGRVNGALGAAVVLLLAAAASAAPGLPGVGAGRCGNGVIDKNEQCEVGSPPESCANLGAGFGTAQCGPECTFDTSTCSPDRFVDNGDGTVSDFQEGLMWEKKVTGSSSGTDSQGVGDCLHCVSDDYDWTTAISEWISAMNGRTESQSSQTGFANHTDWRLPGIVELQTILDCGSSPRIYPIFGPTDGGWYWSASTSANNPDFAWIADFDLCRFHTYTEKSTGPNLPVPRTYPVRAVRTGP